MFDITRRRYERYLAVWQPRIGPEAAELNYRRQRWQSMFYLFPLSAVGAAVLGFGFFDQPWIYAVYLLCVIVGAPLYIVGLRRRRRRAVAAADAYVALPHVADRPPPLQTSAQFDRWVLGKRRLGLEPRPWPQPDTRPQNDSRS